ncbi:MAG: GNAT family N-acetyltransferase [Clostridia bacterium]|nr:GNAT family N-acetyltransferase [Clostridia bacterium]
MKIRRFIDSDAAEVTEMIKTTERISNSKDYSPEYLEAICAKQTPDWAARRASRTHFYVAEEDGRIVGCGAVGPYRDKEDESALFNIFVLPEYQGRGIGRAIVETLESDEFFLRAKRVEIAASITGVGFYRKLGYDFKDGKKELDDGMLYHLEKIRTV